MVHITDLTDVDGLGLVGCAHCASSVDSSAAGVGTVVDGDLSSSVLLCVDCKDNPETQSWLIHHLTNGGDQTQRRSYAGIGSAARETADRAKDHLDAAKRRVEDAKKFSRAAAERVRGHRDGHPPQPEDEPG